MKKIFRSLFILLGTFFLCGNVFAASANFNVSTSANQVIVGKSVTVSVTISSSSALGSYEYTLNYDKNIFKCTDAGMGLNYAGVVQNNKTKSVTYKYTFTALKSGTAKFYVDSTNAFDFNEGLLSPVNGSKSVKVITAAEYQASLSKNNYLSKLGVDGFDITPEFDKDTLEYTVNVSEDVTSVNIIATPDDKKSNVAGAGNHEVTAGTNSFDIVVVAENGSEKTYKLVVEVIDKNPIIVDYDNKKYTVSKIKTDLNPPTGYNETMVLIEDYEIPGYYSDITKFTLVTLKDDSGTPEYFMYVDGVYTKYIELNFGKLVVYPVSMTKELETYEKGKITIQGNEIECLETSKKSRFKVIYGINVETNEKTLYLYDTTDGVAVAYDGELIDTLNNKISLITYIAIGLAASTFICLISLILKGRGKRKQSTKIEKEEIKSKKYKEEKTEDTPLEQEEKEEKKDLDEEIYDIFESDKKKKKH